jgi:hypothetical protein
VKEIPKKTAEVAQKAAVTVKEGTEKIYEGAAEEAERIVGE